MCCLIWNFTLVNLQWKFCLLLEKGQRGQFILFPHFLKPCLVFLTGLALDFVYIFVRFLSVNKCIKCNKTRGFRSFPPEITNWKSYKRLKDRLTEMQEIQNISEIVQKYTRIVSKKIRNIYHPELEIILYWHDFSKEEN